MPELRKDPIVGRWVIIATDRAKRPVRSRVHAAGEQRQVLPLLRGQRRQDAARDPRLPRAAARGPTRRAGASASCPTSSRPCRSRATCNKRGDGIYDKMNGIGAHEVIIECPFHELSMANLTEDNIREVLWVYRDRLVDLKKDPRLVYGMVFKNVGAAAGASLEHTHTQLIVTPIVPINVWEEMTGSLEFFNYRGRCILLRHDPPGAGRGEAHRAGHAELRSFCPVRQPLSLRDVDPAQEPQQPLREHPEERGRRAGHGPEDDPAQAGGGPGQAGVQLHHPHSPFDTQSCRTITGTSRSFRA